MDFHVLAAVFNLEFTKIATVHNKAHKGKPTGHGLPGGRSDGLWDNPEERIKAEIREETGIKNVEILDLISEKQVTVDENIFTRIFYLVVARDDGDPDNVFFNRDGRQEILGWRWIDYSPPQFLNLPPSFYKSHASLLLDDDFQALVSYRQPS